MKKVLVIGSLNMDLVTNVKVTPKVGETILGNGFMQIPGGKGANQAASMGKLESDVTMFGKVGCDGFAEKLIESLKKDHVNIKYVSKSNENATGIALIMINDDGDNSIVVVPGANFDLRPDDITEEIISECDILVAQLETPIDTIEKAFSLAKKMGKHTILNPAPARELSVELLSNTDLLIPNETEFELLTGIEASSRENMINGSKVLFEKGVKSLIITLGKTGSIYIDEEKNVLVSSYKVNAVDTTAAGDSFIAGVVSQLSKGIEIVDAIEFGTKVAAITVGKIGAQTSLPYLSEVDNFRGEKR